MKKKVKKKKKAALKKKMKNRLATKKKSSKPRKKKKDVVASSTKSASKKHHLDRTTFKTSREMDFFSEKELTTQTGHSIEEWPHVFLKETMDNALDACEEADISPIIKITADAAGIAVQDNGPGIPADTIEGAIDFTARVSNREMYVALTRGAQGNALMTLAPMPGVIDPGNGRLIIVANGTHHEISCRADPISQRVIMDDVKHKTNRQKGTLIRIQWKKKTDEDGDVVWPFNNLRPQGPRHCYWETPAFSEIFLSLVRGYVLLNPHLTLSLDWFGEKEHWKATDPSWQKWKPNRPTSSHWCKVEHISRLIAAYINHGRERGSDRTVADFVKEFGGLSGTKKRKLVLDETDVARTKLSDLATNDGLKQDVIGRLLDAMKKNTKPVKPARLGIIGKDHLAKRFKELRCDPEQFQYEKKLGVENGLPYVLESAFGWLGDDAEDRRHIFAGANWSPGIKNPFRSFGSTGEGLEAQLTNLRAGADEPIVFMLHLARPRVEYTDRGKSALVVGDDHEEEEDYDE